MLPRRQFLQVLGAGALAGVVPGLSVAMTPGDARLVVVILRGALDGLAAVPALGDPNYLAQRGALALDAAQTATHDLDGFFRLHPALSRLHGFYRAGELTVLHAIASPYRDRSHFDGQDVLETGSTGHNGLRDGWLNRALAILPMASPQRALAIGSTVPLILRGDSPTTSWAPSRMPDASEDTLARIASMYAPDARLSARLAQAQAASALAAGQSPGTARVAGQQLRPLAAAAGRFLAAEEGARIAVLEAGGWDTHANQGTDAGALANRLAQLDAGLAELAGTLGPAWQQTAVAVVTEFGRTVLPNGSRGTDHGTGSCAFLLGGAVAGGRVLADWPGLSRADLYDGRDLRPTLDLRRFFKGLLKDHLGLSAASLNRTVFPESEAAQALAGLLRA